MLTVLILSVVAPVAVAGAFLALRKRVPTLVADVRGIALQTVIIMVVLLAIAGAIAGVLLTRGGEAVEDLESQQLLRAPADYSVSALCVAAGFTWDTTAPGTCSR